MSSTSARNVSPLCPRCEQGQVFPAKIAATGELLQVCEECEATWDAAEVLTLVRFRDLGTLFEERGLSSVWDELELPALDYLGPRRGTIREVQLSRPVLVTGIVRRHEPSGFYLDIGVEQDGLVDITSIKDGPVTPVELPRVGRVVQAALLGRTGSNAQPRLSVRPSDLAAARQAARTSPSWSATAGAPEPEFVLPDDVDDFGWELESKGCFLNGTVVWSGRDFLVDFYDPVRLAQTIASELEQSRHTTLDRRVVVVDRVTPDAMRAAARALPPSFFDGA